MSLYETTRTIREFTKEYNSREDFEDYAERTGQVGVGEVIIGDGDIIYELELSHENIAELCLTWDADVPEGCSLDFYFRELYSDAVNKDEDSYHFRIGSHHDENLFSAEYSRDSHHHHFVGNSNSDYGLIMNYSDRGLSVEKDDKSHPYYIIKDNDSDDFALGMDLDGIYLSIHDRTSYESGWIPIEEEKGVTEIQEHRIGKGKLQLKISLRKNSWDETPTVKSIKMHLSQIRKFVLPDDSYGYRLYKMNHRYRGELEYNKHSLFIHQMLDEINRINDIYNTGNNPLKKSAKDITKVYVTGEEFDYISHIPMNSETGEESSGFLELDDMRRNVSKLERDINSLVQNKWGWSS